MRHVRFFDYESCIGLAATGHGVTEDGREHYAPLVVNFSVCLSVESYHDSLLNFIFTLRVQR